jgi:hypothetical protein
LSAVDLDPPGLVKEVAPYELARVFRDQEAILTEPEPFKCWVQGQADLDLLDLLALLDIIDIGFYHLASVDGRRIKVGND